MKPGHRPDPTPALDNSPVPAASPDQPPWKVEHDLGCSSPIPSGTHLPRTRWHLCVASAWLSSCPYRGWSGGHCRKCCNGCWFLAGCQVTPSCYLTVGSSPDCRAKSELLKRRGWLTARDCTPQWHEYTGFIGATQRAPQRHSHICTGKMWWGRVETQVICTKRIPRAARRGQAKRQKGRDIHRGSDLPQWSAEKQGGQARPLGMSQNKAEL